MFADSSLRCNDRVPPVGDVSLTNVSSRPLSVSSAAVAAATWLKDGVPARTGRGLQQRRDGTRLSVTMERVRQEDAGTYSCQLVTAEGRTVTSATWTLRVHSKTRRPSPIRFNLSKTQEGFKH